LKSGSISSSTHPSILIYSGGVEIWRELVYDGGCNALKDRYAIGSKYSNKNAEMIEIEDVGYSMIIEKREEITCAIRNYFKDIEGRWNRLKEEFLLAGI